MPGAPKLPPTPDPKASTDTAFGYGEKAASASQLGSAVGQSDPYGSLTYSTSINPITGQPQLSASTNYSPQQQQILDQLQRLQQTQGGTGANLAGNISQTYSTPPNFTQGANSLTAQAEKPVQDLFERFMTPEREQLDTRLRNQGIMPGTPAYQQQVDKLTNQQNLTKGSWLANFQPQAFQEAQQSYFAPEQMISSMFGMGQPSNLPGSFINTPGYNVNDPNFLQAQSTSLNYATQRAKMMSDYQNNLMAGIMGLPLAIAGGPAGGMLAGKMLGYSPFGGGGAGGSGGS